MAVPSGDDWPEWPGSHELWKKSPSDYTAKDACVVAVWLQECEGKKGVAPQHYTGVQLMEWVSANKDNAELCALKAEARRERKRLKGEQPDGEGGEGEQEVEQIDG